LDQSTYFQKLPAGFFDTRDFPAISQLAEADTAQFKIANITVTAATTPTTVDAAIGEFLFAARFSALIFS
jgi:hypothetical protein